MLLDLFGKYILGDYRLVIWVLEHTKSEGASGAVQDKNHWFVRITGIIQSNCHVTVHNEFKRIRKEKVATYYRVTSLDGHRKTTKKLSRPTDLPVTSQKQWILHPLARLHVTFHLCICITVVANRGMAVKLRRS